MSTKPYDLIKLIQKVGSSLVIIGGVALIAIGTLGLVLPVLPGWILIIVGLVLLGEKTWLSRFIINKMPPKMKEKFLSLSKGKNPNGG